MLVTHLSINRILPSKNPGILKKEGPVCARDNDAVLWTQGHLGVSSSATVYIIYMFGLFREC